MSFRQRLLDAIRRRVRHARVLGKAREMSLDRLRRVSAGQILVLCYGNIYRSPFVERKLAASLPRERWTVRSAGFHHRTRRACAPDYVSMAQTYGVSLGDHRSRRVTRQDLQQAELVIIMDRRNWDMVQALAPEDAHKVVWIGSALAGEKLEVEDPYGLSREKTDRILRRLDKASDALADYLR